MLRFIRSLRKDCFLIQCSSICTMMIRCLMQHMTARYGIVTFPPTQAASTEYHNHWPWSLLLFALNAQKRAQPYTSLTDGDQSLSINTQSQTSERWRCHKAADERLQWWLDRVATRVSCRQLWRISRLPTQTSVGPLCAGIPFPPKAAYHSTSVVLLGFREKSRPVIRGQC